MKVKVELHYPEKPSRSVELEDNAIPSHIVDTFNFYSMPPTELVIKFKDRSENWELLE